MKERTKSIDIMKGILIILVVVAHAENDMLHDVIFMFHMPLFFMISGFLVHREKLVRNDYILQKIKSLMIPYIVYMVLDLLIVKKLNSVHDVVYAVWGGRAVTGVYWYITCYIFSLIVLSVLLRKLSDEKIKYVILFGGVIAVLESNYIMDRIRFFSFPGVPWNLDVTLIAIVYIGIGFFYKKQIRELLVADKVVYDIISVIAALVLILFCYWIYKFENSLYWLDMKLVYYKELISAILIPSCFGIVLMRLIHAIEKLNCLDKLKRFFVLCGRATLPIMFMHVPLNHWKETLGYGRSIYILIGIGIPLIFTMLFKRMKIIRIIFGVPNF